MIDGAVYWSEGSSWTLTACTQPLSCSNTRTATYPACGTNEVLSSWRMISQTQTEYTCCKTDCDLGECTEHEHQATSKPWSAYPTCPANSVMTKWQPWEKNDESYWKATFTC